VIVLRLFSDYKLTVIHKIGLLGTLPGEIREIIYRYVFSTDCTDLEDCSCIRHSQRSKSGLGLLRTSGRIYNEAVPVLYGSDMFGIQAGYAETDLEAGNVTWLEPTIYRQTTFDQQAIRSLPHNALHLIQNLEIEFVNDTMVYPNEREWSFIVCTNKFEHIIHQLCTLLKDCTQLNCLDISISFGCKFADIDYMARLVEPIKMLRGIKNPTLTVHGYQYVEGFLLPTEPRWHLHHEFEDFLNDLLKSPHGTPTPPSDSLEVFHDSFENEDGDLPGSIPRKYVLLGGVWDDDGDDGDDDAEPYMDTDQEMVNYLQDVYGTDDLEALHGGLPARWQIFLNSEVRNKVSKSVLSLTPKSMMKAAIGWIL
jgi:hypothetical protein